MNTTIPLNIHRNPLIKNVLTFFSNPLALAVGLVFASDSLLFSSWLAHIPEVKARLGLSDGQLGLVLFAMPAGLLTMNPFTGRIIARLGEAKACLWSAVGLALTVCIPVNAPNALVLSLGLFLMGLNASLINVAMNTAATNLERQQNIVIMSACHGMWSLGGLIGSGVAGIIIAQHIPPSWHVFALSGLILLLTVLLQPRLAQIPSSSRTSTGEKAGSSFVKPTVDLWLMILIGITVSMGEGVALDWSAVYLHETLGASSQVAALGFGCFSLTMTGLRFVGDAITPRIGARRWLIIGGFVGAAGLALAVLVPYPPTALIGFALLGVGCSLGAPILYAAALRIPGIPPAAGLATFASFSFVGFLAGPPLIGFIAEAAGLPYGLSFVALMMLVSSLISRKVNLY
ncbi:MFS transporter [Spirosoma rhododendri]|uniref:MFS transporter n=1 Tax=Spirosoma rhododendri TaxID=2728024 RepID=A0A7L5DFX0_9BACT|nr:MFS transporter [Spirosoma rhododendri]QJD77076.1 MFS transporter [Spirosoma rhododendri]